MSDNNKPNYRVRTVQKAGDRTFYHDLGVAWVKDNGVISVQLYGAPLNNLLLIVPIKDEAAGEGAGA